MATMQFQSLSMLNLTFKPGCMRIDSLVDMTFGQLVVAVYGRTGG